MTAVPFRRLLGQELRRSWTPVLWATSVVLLALSILVRRDPAPLPGILTSALLQHFAAPPPALNMALLLEIGFTLAPIVPLVALLGDLSDGSRILVNATPSPSLRIALARLVTVLVWSVLWTTLAIGSADLAGLPLPLLRDLALLVPEALFVVTLTFAATELTGEAGIGLAVCVVVVLLGAGLPGLPFPHAAPANLELFDARNRALSRGLWANRAALAALSVPLAGLGVLGMASRRTRGHRGRPQGP